MGGDQPREGDKALLQRAASADASDAHSLEIAEIYFKPAFRDSQLVSHMGKTALEEQFGTKFADGLVQSARFGSVRPSATDGLPAAFRVEMIIDAIDKKKLPGGGGMAPPAGRLSEAGGRSPASDPKSEKASDPDSDDDGEATVADDDGEGLPLRDEPEETASSGDGGDAADHDGDARAASGSGGTLVTLRGAIKISDPLQKADPTSRVLDIEVELAVDQPFEQERLPLQAIAGLIDGFVERSVHEVINQVHPIRFVKPTGDRDDKQFVLDRGRDGGLDPGDVLQIVELGEELVSAGGMSLGREKSTLGTVVIEQIEERFSLAALSDDNIDFDYRDQDIILTIDPDATASAEEDERKRQRGGVKIVAIAPMDLARSDAVAFRHGYLSSYLNQGLASSLKATGRYDIVERRKLGTLFEELKFNDLLAAQRRGETDPALEKLATWRLVDYLVFVQIDKLFAYESEKKSYAVLSRHRQQRMMVAEAQIRLVDVSTSTIDVVETLRLDEPIDASDSLLGGTMIDVLARRMSVVRLFGTDGGVN